MSIWASTQTIGWDDERPHRRERSVLSYADHYSGTYPGAEEPASVDLAVIPHWCVPGITEGDVEDATGPWPEGVGAAELERRARAAMRDATLGAEVSQTTRPKPTYMTVCDFCDQEIDDRGEPGESGSLTNGFIAHKVEMPRTKRVWLIWPPAGRDRLMSWKEKQTPRNSPRRYDFHAQCILTVIEDAIAARSKEPK